MNRTALAAAHAAHQIALAAADAAHQIALSHFDWLDVRPLERLDPAVRDDFDLALFALGCGDYWCILAAATWLPDPDHNPGRVLKDDVRRKVADCRYTVGCQLAGMAVTLMRFLVACATPAPQHGDELEAEAHLRLAIEALEDGDRQLIDTTAARIWPIALRHGYQPGAIPDA